MNMDLRTAVDNTEPRNETLPETFGYRGENKEDGARFLNTLENASGSRTTMTTWFQRTSTKKSKKGKRKKETQNKRKKKPKVPST